MPAFARAPPPGQNGGGGPIWLIVGSSAGVCFVVALLALIVRRRSNSRSRYPHLLPPTQALAVKHTVSPGVKLRQSPSPLQSPVDSTPSPMTPVGTLLHDRIRRLSPCELPMERGQIDLSLSYDPLSLSLQVGVIRCINLCELSVSPSGQCLLDPYVKLQLLPDREHRVKTRIVRATNSPQFDEQFTMYGVGGEELAASTLHIQVVAFDRYCRDAVVGEAIYRLEDAQLSLYGQKAITLSLGPHAIPAQRGDILLSLTYHPALNNLTIVVLKARGLVRADPGGSSDPYVKLSLRTESGHRIAKRKTHIRRGTRNPTFNESFVFELPQSALQTGVVDVHVMHHAGGNRSESLGRVLLTGSDAHIVDAIATPDQQVAQWHPLD